MHPSDEIRGSKNDLLLDKKIILAVTGSIAAVETIKLARELIRYGADVIPVMTPSATKIIHPYALEFATGHKPIIELTGETEHVVFCGKVKNPADLLLIAPCTANTISKISHGIDDTPVTTFATTALGSGVPILIVPAMHRSMYDHKFIQENIERCKEKGIHFIEPILMETKAKIADIDTIVAWSIRITGRKDLQNRNILIIGGGTSESIDDVRSITNKSSGKTAISLAESAFYRGGKVKLWYGTNSQPPPSFIPTTRFESIEDLLKLIDTEEIERFDIIIVCAALSDYIPMKVEGKIPSDREELIVKLKPAPRIIPEIRSRNTKSIIVGFKVEGTSKESLEEGEKLLDKYKIDYIVTNTTDAFGRDENEINIICRDKKIYHFKGLKRVLADKIYDVILRKNNEN